MYDTSKHPDVLEGRMTPEECLADFAQQWDDENAPDGKITPKEFLEYYKDVSASIDRDDYFELMMRNGKLLGISAFEICLDMSNQILPLLTSASHCVVALLRSLAWHISGGAGASANTSCLRVLVVHDDGSQTVEEVEDDLGLDKKNIAEIIARLEAQGINDIKKISLTDAM